MKNKKALNATLISIGAIATIGTPIGVMYSINQSSHSATLTTKPKKELVVHRDKPLTAMELVNKIIAGELGILDLSVKDYLKIIEALKNPHSEIRFLVENLSPQSKAIVEQIDKIDIGTFKLVLEIIFERGLTNVTKDEISKVQNALSLLFKSNDNNWWLNLLKYIPTIISDGLGKLFLDNDEDFFKSLNSKIVHNILQDVVKTPTNKAATLQAQLVKIANQHTPKNNAEFTSSFAPKFSNAAANAIVLAKASSKSQAELAKLIKDSVIKTFNTNKEQAFNDIIPLVVKQISGILVPKPDLKTDADKKVFAKKLESLEKNLFNLFHKVLITGFTSSREIAKDLNTILYQITDKIPKSYVYPLKIPVLGTYDIDIPVKSIMEDALTHFVDGMIQPSKGRIDKEVEDLKKTELSLKEKIKKLQVESANLALKITNAKKRPTHYDEATYTKATKELAASGSKQPYSAVVFLFSNDNDALADISKFNNDDNDKDYYNKPNHFLRSKWYEDKQKGLWVLARSLWLAYPSQNKNFSDKEAWYSQLEKDWKHGITKAPINYGWWDRWWYGKKNKPGGGPSENPNSTRLLKTVENAYGPKVLEALNKQWTNVHSPEAKNLIDVATNIQEYRSKKDEVDALEKANAKNAKSLNNLNKELKTTSDKIIALPLLNVYKHEVTKKITAAQLAKNGLLHGQGLLQLNSDDLSNVLYKMQDLLLGLKDYISKAIDQTIGEAISKAIDETVDNNVGVDKNEDSSKSIWGNIWDTLKKGAAAIGKGILKATVGNLDVVHKDAKKAINNQVIPQMNELIKNNIKPELVTAINNFDPDQLAMILNDVINKGLQKTLIKTNNASLVRLLFNLRRVANIKLSNQDFLNMIVAIKNGLNALPKPNQVALIRVLLEQFSLSKQPRLLIENML